MRSPLIALGLLLATSLTPTHAEDSPRPIPFAVFASGRDRPAAVDVNGDGFADLVAFAGHDVWVALSEQGQKCRSGSVWLAGFASPDEGAAAADFDGDGRVDVLAVKKDGTIKLGLSDGKALTLATWSCADGADLRALVARPLVAADVDGDGFCDLVFLPSSAEPAPCTLLRNTGLRSFAAPVAWLEAPKDALAGTFAGDGKAQLAWLRDGRVLVARAGAAPEVWAEDVVGPLLAAGDMNGDGRADLAVRGAWLLSHGAGFVRFADARLAPSTEAALSIGDLDGDGEGDAFVFERAGECLVKVLLARGPHFSRPEVWASLGLRGEERVVDLGERRVVVGESLMEGDGKLGVLPPRPAPALDLPRGPHVVARLGGRTGVFEPDRARSLFDEGWTRSVPFAGRGVTKMLAPDVALVGTTVLVALARGAEAFTLEPRDAEPLFAARLVGDATDLVARVPGGLAILARDERLRAFRQVGPVFRGPGTVIGVADLVGDGRAQLLLAGRAGDLLVARLGGALDRDADGLSDREEVRLHGTDPSQRDTDGDGLVDGWEVTGFRGERLDRLGARPAHRDLFLELAVEQDADMPRVRRAVARMEKLFAAAPIDNVDGTRGIAFHGVVGKRVPRPSEHYGPSRHELREMYFTPRRAGLFHWMHLAARGGGGQADLMSDQGSCAGVFEATLPHEFGHQIGLNHGGDRGANGTPNYPSLMNYAYNYDLSIGYSEGALAGLALDERALPERIAVPFDKLKYLAGSPFHFRVEPFEGGTKTWVDWNRDGLHDEAPVMANVNATSGEGYGPRHLLDQISAVATDTTTTQEPVLVDVAGDLALLYAKKGTGELMVRVLPAKDQDPAHFSKPRKLLDAAGADLSAVAIGAELHVFSTHGGLVVEARGTLEKLDVVAVVGSGRAAAVARAGRIHVFLLAPDGSVRCGETVVAGVKSACPPGVALDTVADELLLVTIDERTYRLRLTRLDPETLTVKKTEPVGGPRGSDATSRRPAVVFETAAWLPREGRVNIFHAGILDVPSPNTHMYRSYTIGDKSWLRRGGWKEDQTWNEWSYSTAGPGAALHDGHPWHASRFYTPYGAPNRWDDHVTIAPHADGICDSGIKDHDDWKLIRDRGLERSILTIAEPRGRVAIGK